MATHDYVISNASGAAVRADLNNALAAIVSNNSNATEPSTTYAYQWWADIGSSPAVMKLRNAANDGWITLFQLDGEWSTIALEDGTDAAPSLYFKDSGTDTGFFSGGTDQVNITTGGTERVEWGTSEVVFNDGGENYDFRIEGDTNSSLFFVDASADAVGVGTASPNYSLDVVGDQRVTNSAGNTLTVNRVSDPGSVAWQYSGTETGQIQAVSGGGLNFYVGSTPTLKATLDSSGRLLVGTASARANTFNGSVSQAFQIEGTTNTGRGAAIFSSSSVGNEPAYLVLGHQKSGSIGGNTALADGDEIGLISFQGSDGSEFVDGARIAAFVDGTSGANDLPTRLVFSTTADGSAYLTERLRIAQNGDITSVRIYNQTGPVSANVGVDSNGLLFRATSSAKYKTNIETIEDSYSQAILNCRPVWYQAKETPITFEPGWGYWGFIAEEVAQIDPRLVQWKTYETTYDENGSVVQTPCDPEPDGVLYDRFVPHLLNLIKRQQQAIETLEAKVAALESA